MREFKVGDNVRVVSASCGWGFIKAGDVGVVIEVPCSYGELQVDFPNQGRWRGVEKDFVLEAPYPNPPHKHAEVIKAWADGAEIEAHNSLGWHPLTSPYPEWRGAISYRIKPASPSPAEKERDEIKAEMEKLTKRLEALEVK
jgi:hypothetical protein